MIRSPYATSFTKFGERDMTNNKHISVRRRYMGGRQHPDQHFKLTKAHARYHNEHFRKPCGLDPLSINDIIGR